MLPNSPDSLRKLAPPGAPLPWWQQLLNRTVVPLFLRRHSWEKSDRVLRKSCERIVAAVSPLETGILEQRILVAPRWGLEDSSRYWSVAMTLRHLCLVNEAMLTYVASLENEVVPPGQPNTAAVKPEEVPGVQAVRAYRTMVESRIERALATLSRRNSTATLRHPWFGPLRSREWFSLLGIHQRLHETQIRDILRELGVHTGALR